MTLTFPIRVQTRRIAVVVFDTLAELRADYRKRGGRGGKRTYAFVARLNEKRPVACFSRKHTGSETVAHEAVHIGFMLVSQPNTIAKEEPLAEATGRAMSALVTAFYKHGVYKK